jgi:hypothetical protein
MKPELAKVPGGAARLNESLIIARLPPTRTAIGFLTGVLA